MITSIAFHVLRFHHTLIEFVHLSQCSSDFEQLVVAFGYDLMDVELILVVHVVNEKVEVGLDVGDLFPAGTKSGRLLLRNETPVGDEASHVDVLDEEVGQI